MSIIDVTVSGSFGIEIAEAAEFIAEALAGAPIGKSPAMVLHASKATTDRDIKQFAAGFPGRSMIVVREQDQPQAATALHAQAQALEDAAARMAQGGEWDGKGLPPVGVECECCYTSPSEYYRVKIIAHDDDKAVYRWVDGPLALKLGDSDNQPLGAVTDPHPKFRPIRTPEQIAADERERAVADMKIIWSKTGSHRFHALYDAGYRKIDTSQPIPAEISSDIKQANLNRLAEKVLALNGARGGGMDGYGVVARRHGCSSMTYPLVPVCERDLDELVALAKELKQ